MKQNNDCLVRSKKLADLQVETNQEGKIKIYISKISNESWNIATDFTKDNKSSPPTPVHVVNFSMHFYTIWWSTTQPLGSEVSFSLI